MPSFPIEVRACQSRQQRKVELPGICTRLCLQLKGSSLSIITHSTPPLCVLQAQIRLVVLNNNGICLRHQCNRNVISLKISPTLTAAEPVRSIFSLVTLLGMLLKSWQISQLQHANFLLLERYRSTIQVTDILHLSACQPSFSASSSPILL